MYSAPASAATASKTSMAQPLEESNKPPRFTISSLTCTVRRTYSMETK